MFRSLLATAVGAFCLSSTDAFRLGGLKTATPKSRASNLRADEIAPGVTVDPAVMAAGALAPLLTAVDPAHAYGQYVGVSGSDDAPLFGGKNAQALAWFVTLSFVFWVYRTAQVNPDEETYDFTERELLEKINWCIRNGDPETAAYLEGEYEKQMREIYGEKPKNYKTLKAKQF
uniref:Uncharacterized protein n=1 Tax=Chromera velia CCMP2878 TaxID=1169474 RepID=A0A0G4GD27_9ALVE|mmetsp:Transcript_26317/g.51730  ORF Transcript_26317/g.51730 Transcript_26317/m.51730 type:complete len:174 (-) Transcript_26317:508-1029(-)|eukprot:Cvel_4506.t1-p1 / transcript=Cvel_4506.t1 / gene=Cvel_4506 / organism=Chromera_velia_CCMP2878 / gene_product=hypothetical protein / transcript_product=hypothetical protein / location=Cvel_scaffold197:46814-49911(-) / protein_length=173 / sequence_SO=supercontig / SO=protein_coding / is_pseudo=false